MKTKQQFKVFNYTDNIYATMNIFNTKKEARDFITQFKNRFKIQGYYRDNQQNKININEIDLEIIPIDFNPYK